MILLSGCATRHAATAHSGVGPADDRDAEDIIHDVAGKLRTGVHIYERSTFPSLTAADARRLRRITYANIDVLERIMGEGDEYDKEVVVFGVALGVNETALRGEHDQFIADVYAFINSLKEARSGTSPPRTPRREILYEYSTPSHDD